MPRQRLFLLIILSVTGVISVSTLNCGKENPQGPPDVGSLADTIPPAAVTDLVVKSPTSYSLAIVWISPGDDGTTGQAERYDIRYFSSVITSQNWDSAAAVSGVPQPKPAGRIETIVVTGLPSSTDIYFALKTYDEVPNESDLSNCAMGTTKPEHVPPAVVTDLTSVAISDTEFLLTWTAPGDDGMVGDASEYDIRYSDSPITEENWGAADQVTGEPVPKPTGQPDSFEVTGLLPGTNYCFALKTADEVPNWSEVSDWSPALALSEYLWAVPVTVTVGEEMKVSFRTSPGGLAEATVWGKRFVFPDWIPYVFRHLASGTFPVGAHVVTWDLLSDQGEPIPERYPTSYHLKLHWGGVPVDSQYVRIHPAP